MGGSGELLDGSKINLGDSQSELRDSIVFEKYVPCESF